MKERLHRLVSTCVATGIIGVVAMAGNVSVAADAGKPASNHAQAMHGSPTGAASGDLAQRIEEGKKIAFDRSKGNCLACHALPGGEMPGNIGPKLPYPGISMKQRFPDRAKLHAQIFNPMVNNPNTVMPPFGMNHILTEDELEKVTDYIWSL